MHGDAADEHGRRMLNRRSLEGINFGDLDETRPISSNWGFDRGTPIDRYYIEIFLQRHSAFICGNVLEIQSSGYSQRFGGGRIGNQQVLDIDTENRRATIVGDLSVSGTLTQSSFDCVLITQTLQLIHEVSAAVAELHRALKPEGTALITVPGISQIDSRIEWHWSFTEHSARRIFAKFFGGENTNVSVFGNVFAATAFLQGIAVEDVDKSKLDVFDPNYPVIIAICAQKNK